MEKGLHVGLAKVTFTPLTASVQARRSAGAYSKEEGSSRRDALLVARGGGKHSVSWEGGGPLPLRRPLSAPWPWAGRTHPWKRLLFVQGALGLQG